MAIVRLQEELIYSKNNHCFEYGYMSLPTPEKDGESTILVNTSPRQSSISEREEHRVLDLLDLDTIPQIKATAVVMFASSNKHAFCEAFVRFWKGAFAVCLTFLDVEEVGFEDVVRMEWEYLSSRIKKWCFAIKKFFIIYLANAKLLIDQVLGEYGDESSRCLIEASKPSLMLFSSFACAVVVRPHQHESLFCLLDMYEDLVPLIPCIEDLFPCEIGFSIGAELNKLVTRIQDYASISMELGKAIQPSPNCGIHPLTKDVLNYILSHGDYDHADLIRILKEENEDDSDEEQSFSDAVAVHVHSIALALEGNIAKRSELHGDLSLQHIFMMNNIHYMYEMIRSSKMKSYFGGEWLKSQVKKFQFHGLSYERSTWGSILHLLRYDLRARKATLEARCRKFTAALDKVYEKQRDWCVPNIELRQELRILASTNAV